MPVCRRGVGGNWGREQERSALETWVGKESVWPQLCVEACLLLRHSRAGALKHCYNLIEGEAQAGSGVSFVVAVNGSVTRLLSQCARAALHRTCHSGCQGNSFCVCWLRLLASIAIILLGICYLFARRTYTRPNSLFHLTSPWRDSVRRPRSIICISRYAASRLTCVRHLQAAESLSSYRPKSKSKGKSKSKSKCVGVRVGRQPDVNRELAAFSDLGAAGVAVRSGGGYGGSVS